MPAPAASPVSAHEHHDASVGARGRGRWHLGAVPWDEMPGELRRVPCQTPTKSLAVTTWSVPFTSLIPVDGVHSYTAAATGSVYASRYPSSPERGNFFEIPQKLNQKIGMSDLQNAIEQVRDKIARYSKTKAAINEQNTKATLIQPILRSLGWDVEDLDDVHMEYKERAADKPVDYALLLLRSPCAFVEAKALGSSLDDRKWANQIMGYAGVAGVEWVVLTDGDEYRIYNSHATVPVDQKLFRTVRISEPSSDPKSTLCLLSKELMRERQINHLWELHFVDRQVQFALRALFSSEGEPSAAVVRLLGRHIKSLAPSEIKASLRRIEIQVSCPLTIEPRRPAEPKPVAREKRKQATKRKKARTVSGITLAQLIDAGVISAPLKLFRKYKGAELSASVVADGSVEFAGQRYDSCSMAASFARGTVVGGTPATNGWTFWKYRDADGKVRQLDHSRGLFHGRSQEKA